MESPSDSIEVVLATFRAWAKANRSSSVEDFLQDVEVPDSFASRLRTHLSHVTAEVAEDGLTTAHEGVVGNLEFPLVDEKFRILRLIGEGGMGRVYEAFDTESDSRIALKTFRAVTPRNLVRLKAEFRELVDIDHPNLVKLLGLHEHLGSWHYTMELIDGVDIVSFVQRRPSKSQGTGIKSKRSRHGLRDRAGGPGDLRREGLSIEPIEETVELAELNTFEPDHVQLRLCLLQLIDAIECLHHNGKLHRDIKPSNTLVDRSGRLRLLDFGLVQDLADAFEEKSQSYGIVGTIPYMSPEQSHGDTLTTASDWYSLGVLLYECLTGRLPFAGSFTEQRERKANGDWEPIDVDGQRIPLELYQLCIAWLASNPSVRPGADDAREILDANTLNRRVPHAISGGFEGRSEELNTLRDGYRISAQSRFVVRTIVGESGIGKTALARRFLDELGADAIVIKGAAYDRESIPFNGLDSLVDAIVRVIDSRADITKSFGHLRNLQYLATLFPIIRSLDVFNSHTDDASVPIGSESRNKAFQCLVEIVGNLRRSHPVVIHVDDAQWLDEDSIAWLRELLRANDLPAVMLILTSTVELDLSIDWASANIDFESIKVGPLDQQSIARILSSGLGSTTESLREKVDELSLTSQGSPLLATLASAQLNNQGVECSSDYQQMLQELTESLSSRSQEVLKIISIYGSAMRWSYACSASFGLDDEPLVYRELRAKNLIRLDRYESDVRYVDLYHSRFRRWIRDGLDESDLLQLNQAVANTLESAGANPGAIAKHMLASGQHDNARKYFMDAARRATEILAFAKAAEMFGAAADLVRGEERLSVLMGKADALAKAGHAKDSADLLVEIADQSAGDSRLDAMRKAATQFLSCGEIDRGLTLYEESGRKVEMSKPKIAAMLFGNRWAAGWRRRTFRPSDKSPENENLLKNVDTDWETALGIGLVDPILSACYQARCMNGAYRLKDRYRIARALPIEAAQISVAGQRASRLVESYLQDARQLNRSLSSPYITGILEFGDAVCEFLRGRWRNAITKADEAERIFRDECVGAWLELDNVRKIPLSALSWLGECEQLSSRLDSLYDEGSRRGNLGLLTNPNSSALAMLARDQPELAKNELDRRLEEWSRGVFDIQRLLAIHGYTLIDLYQGDGNSAMERIEKQWKLVSRSLFMNVQLLKGMMHMCRATAAIASLDTRGETSRRQALRSVRALEREDAEWARALGAMLRASLELSREGTNAVANLESAMNLLEKSEVRLHAAAAKWQIGRLTGDSRMQKDAESWMLRKGIRWPNRIAHMLCPVYVASLSDNAT